MRRMAVLVLFRVVGRDEHEKGHARMRPFSAVLSF
jgi:hypothetical protein